VIFLEKKRHKREEKEKGNEKKETKEKKGKQKTKTDKNFSYRFLFSLFLLDLCGIKEHNTVIIFCSVRLVC